jgi:eukaryotic-like serine/threonine-protein kinase
MEAAIATPPRQITAYYTLHERLGGGGQGEVWHAHDARFSIDIALKILRAAPGRSSAAWDALLHEHESASRLDHPHILKVFTPEREGGMFFLPMELATGGDLRRLRGGDYLAIVPVLIQVAQALQHAHERGVIHRDLKPGNVLFDERGSVKLADFGVSGRAPDPGTDALIRGLSPFTASPEQLRGEPPTPADDVYGLGALAYELLSGHPPHYPNFDAWRVQQEPAPPLTPTKPIPPQLAMLVARMLAKTASERPASMSEVIDELEGTLNDTLTFDVETAEPPHSEPAVKQTADRVEPVRPARREPAVVAVKPVQATRVAQATSPVQTTRVAQATSPARAASVSQPASAGQAAPPVRAAIPAHAASVSRPASAGQAAPPVRAAIPARAAISAQAAATPAQANGAAPAMIATPAGSVRPALRAKTLEPGELDGPALWEEVRQAPLPARTRLEPMRDGPPHALLLLLGLAAASFAAFMWLPKYVNPDVVSRLWHAAPPGDTTAPAAGVAPSTANALSTASAPPNASAPPSAAALAQASFADAHHAFDQHLAALEARAADVWGGADFAAARTRAAEAAGARDAGNFTLAQQRLTQAAKLLDKVEHAAGGALSAELAAGERALAAGQPERARQAFDLAARIDPKSDAARTGLARAKTALGAEGYARAAGEGYAALGAGRLDEARAAFERARALRPDGAEALDGLRRVNTAAGGDTTAADGRNPGAVSGAMRARAEALESQERWDEALRAYEDLLRQDRSLSFARAGKERAADRLLLDESLQQLIDRPDRLANSPQVRQQAAAVLQEALEQPDPGPVLRGQIDRLSALLPGFDKPVHLSLVSDNLTQVAIPSIGSFGSFTRHELELKPGRYTVIGTRQGYREVRRDITVSPGQENVTINVSCDDAI